MIIFEKIRFRNFLSFGNSFTEIDLNTHHNTCILGKNSSGKSVILDALTFVLFNKPFRKINKPQLINSINEKDCVVEVEFTIGTTKWKVVRGQKPNIFEIHRNQELLDQSASAIDQQKWLEQNILKMNYKSFTQIVILGSSNYTPFMQLSPASRREVIEELLDIKIFSSMNMIIKEKIRSVKEEIRTLEIQKTSLFEKIQLQKNFIDEIEKEGKSDVQKRISKIQELESIETSCEDENNSILSEIEKLNTDLENYSGTKDKLKKLSNLKGKLSQKVSNIVKDHKFFTDHNICPTCTQEIDNDFRVSKVKELEESSVELKNAYGDLEKTIKEEENRERKFLSLSQNIVNLNHKISQNNLKVSQSKKQVEDLKSEIKSIKNKIENKNSEHSKLEKFFNEHKEIEQEFLNKKELIEYYDYTYGMLKDNGVKSKIIKKYLPLINQQVNRYLQMMDLYINFSLDEEFNETVKTPVYEDFSYFSFSEGQKQRINLALLFCWREIAKIKNSTNVNLLILDETFDSSLDSYGADDFLKIIRYTVKDSNIFVISHREGVQEKFENILEFQKIGNFSHLNKKLTS